MSRTLYLSPLMLLLACALLVPSCRVVDSEAAGPVADSHDERVVETPPGDAETVAVEDAVSVEAPSDSSDATPRESLSARRARVHELQQEKDRLTKPHRFYRSFRILESATKFVIQQHDESISTPAEVRALRFICAAPEAAKILADLFERASPPGKLYALCGIRHFDRVLYNDGLSQLARSQEIIDFWPDRYQHHKLPTSKVVERLEERRFKQLAFERMAVPISGVRLNSPFAMQAAFYQRAEELIPSYFYKLVFQLEPGEELAQVDALAALAPVAPDLVLDRAVDLCLAQDEDLRTCGVDLLCHLEPFVGPTVTRLRSRLIDAVDDSGTGSSEALGLLLTDWAVGVAEVSQLASVFREGFFQESFDVDQADLSELRENTARVLIARGLLLDLSDRELLDLIDRNALFDRDFLLRIFLHGGDPSRGGLGRWGESQERLRSLLRTAPKEMRQRTARLLAQGGELSPPFRQFLGELAGTTRPIAGELGAGSDPAARKRQIEELADLDAELARLELELIVLKSSASSTRREESLVLDSTPTADEVIPAYRDSTSFRILNNCATFFVSSTRDGSETRAEVRALRILCTHRDARKALEDLLHSATLQGQLYALCGLYYVDRERFDRVVPAYLESTALISYGPAGYLTNVIGVEELARDFIGEGDARRRVMEGDVAYATLGLGDKFRLSRYRRTLRRAPLLVPQYIEELREAVKASKGEAAAVAVLLALAAASVPESIDPVVDLLMDKDERVREHARDVLWGLGPWTATRFRRLLYLYLWKREYVAREVADLFADDRILAHLNSKDLERLFDESLLDRARNPAVADTIEGIRIEALRATQERTDLVSSVPPGTLPRLLRIEDGIANLHLALMARALCAGPAGERWLLEAWQHADSSARELIVDALGDPEIRPWLPNSLRALLPEQEE